MMIWMSPLVLRLRDCIEVIAIGMMPDQIAVDLKLSQVFVEGCARDSCGVFCVLRGQIKCVSIGIRRKIQVQLQTIGAKLLVDRHPILVLNLQEIAIHRWLMDANRLLIRIGCKRHSK